MSEIVINQDGELDETATIEKNSVVQQEGARQVTRRLTLYNPDAILSVAYRVNSRRGVQFRQWATQLLREHLTRGYTLSRQRFEANAHELEVAFSLVRRLAADPALNADAGRGLADIVSRYAQTSLLLQRYDESLLTKPPTQHGATCLHLPQHAQRWPHSTLATFFRALTSKTVLPCLSLM